MTEPSRPLRALAGALLLACLPWFAGCAHHRGRVAGCRQPQFAGDTQTLAPLRAPPGLSTPNTTGGVHIPALNQPVPARERNAPCLDWPPTYVSEPPVPPTRHAASS